METTRYHGKRRAVQLLTLLLLALIPASGLFRIDLANAGFIVLGRPVWWSNFTLVAGLALVVATAPILTYMTIGTVWCGWACPQNLLSEWANNLTHKLLGKRASVDVSSELVVAASRNKLLNWTLLGLAFLVVSLLLALIPFMYFFSPAEMWSLAASPQGPGLARFMQRLYFFCAFLVFVDIAVVRYFWCDYACLYRMGQRMFKTRDALHVAYDETRAADCAKCNYCATACVTGIQPTHIQRYDSCINCGECVDACNRLHAKSGTTGLLHFELGEHEHAATWRERLRDVFSHFNWWVGAVFAAGLALTVWGVLTQPPADVIRPTAANQAALRLDALCRNACLPQFGSCKKGNVAGCMRADACQCQCKLDHAPASPQAAEWRACVRQESSSADAMDAHRGK